MKKLVLILVMLLVLPCLASPDRLGDLVFEQIDAPKQRLSKDWLFLFDNSHSMRGVFAKARAAFVEATRYPTDELNFKVIAFSNEGQQDVLEWQPASAQAFQETDKWLHKNAGIKSYGCKAWELALKTRTPKGGALTVICISDGGFSEGFAPIRRSIASGQAWRKANGLEEALLVSIGIENKGYTAGGKPSDEECQKFMREIGEAGKGGYFLVREPVATTRAGR